MNLSKMSQKKRPKIDSRAAENKPFFPPAFGELEDPHFSGVFWVAAKKVVRGVETGLAI